VSGVTFELRAVNDDDGYFLALMTAQVLPREGDTIVLHGPMFEEPHGQKGDGTEVFTVASIVFEAGVQKEKNKVACIPLGYSEIIVWVRGEKTPYVPLCTCEGDDRMPMTDGTCDNCSGNLPCGARPPRLRVET
jgi:hypothetical protein